MAKKFTAQKHFFLKVETFTTLKKGFLKGKKNFKTTFAKYFSLDLPQASVRMIHNTSTTNNFDSDSEVRIINKKWSMFQSFTVHRKPLLNGLDDAQLKTDHFSIQLVSAHI